MDLSQPGTWPLGADQTLNIVAWLVKTGSAGTNRIAFAPPSFTAEDTLRFEVDPNSNFILYYGPALTLPEVDAALTALGILPATATAEQRNLVKEILKTKQLGG
jgi:hypothetical protein